MSFVLPPNTKKINFEKSKIKDEVTKTKSDFCKYYEIELKTNNIKQDESYNAYLFHINKLFFVVDIDSEPAFNYVNELIEKHQIKNVQSTKSISNFKDVNNFKFHLYFKNNLNIESNKSFGKLELFINKLIFEDAKRFNNNINLNDLPDLTEDFYKDLLLFKCPSKNKKVVENKIIISNNTNNEDENKIIISNNTNNEDENKIIELVELIDECHANNYNEWYNIGQAIYNINPDYINIFDLFSKKATIHYNIKEINKKWIEYKKPIDKNKKKLTLGTLRDYAAKDNNELYKKWCIKYNYSTNLKYSEIKTTFEINNFKINNPVSYGTINFEGNLIKRNRKDFLQLYENLNYLEYNKKGDEEEINFPSKWFKDPNIKTYEKIDFLPMQTAPNNIYNSFDCYEVLKNNSNNEELNLNFEETLIYKHIKNLCNNDESCINYFIKFLARKLKHPYKLTNTALIFKSKQGAGKDLFFNWFGHKIIGSKYYDLTEKPHLLFGQFTSLLENKILIVINETSGKDTFEINENIKSAITTKINIIEDKGGKPFNNTNNIGYIFLSNNDNPLKIPHDDRRFCGIECNNDICNNADYFNKLVDEMESGKYNKLCYDYLLNIDCENYDFTNNRPITDFYNDMKEINTPLIVKFFKNIYLIGEDNYKGMALFNAFNDYIKLNNFKCEYTTTKFGLDVKKFKGVNKKRMSNFIEYNINKEELKKYLIDEYKMEFYNEKTDPQFIED